MVNASPMPLKLVVEVTTVFYSSSCSYLFFLNDCKKNRLIYTYENNLMVNYTFLALYRAKQE